MNVLSDKSLLLEFFEVIKNVLLKNRKKSDVDFYVLYCILTYYIFYKYLKKTCCRPGSMQIISFNV